MSSDAPRLSAVICTRNRADLIGQAVASVLANDHPSFELVVVDQSDGDEAGEVVRDRFGDDPRLRYIDTGTVGLSVARNIGVRAGRGETVAFTDDDCIVATDWLTRTEEAFAANPDVDLMYGYVDGAEENEDGKVPRLPFERRSWMRPDRRFWIFGMGANFAVRRSLFDRIGPFDEMLGAGGPLPAGEDFDLMYRAYLAGATRLHEPSSRVTHYGLRRPDEWPRTLYSYGAGDAGFYVKHARCGDGPSLRLALRKVAGVCRGALGSRRAYFRGFMHGARQSLRYPIDREHRIYLPR